MGSLINVFVSSVRHSPSQISVKMCPKFHVIHCMSQTLTISIIVALTDCLQSLPNSLSGRLDVICHAGGYSSESCGTWQFPPLCYGFLDACLATMLNHLLNDIDHQPLQLFLILLVKSPCCVEATLPCQSHW